MAYRARGNEHHRDDLHVCACCWERAEDFHGSYHDPREEPNGLWSLAVDVISFKTDENVRIKGADWLNAIEGAAAFIRALAGGRVKDDGGTITPLLLPR